jgi:hypothetical protein
LLRRRRTLTWWRRTAFSMISSRRDRTASTATLAISLADLRGASCDHSRSTRPRTPRPDSSDTRQTHPPLGARTG